MMAKLKVMMAQWQMTQSHGMMALAWWRSWPKPRLQVCQQSARAAAFCPAQIAKYMCLHFKMYLSKSLNIFVIICFRCASRRPEPRPFVLPRNHPTLISLSSPWPSTQGKGQNIWFWGVLLGKKAIHNRIWYVLYTFWLVAAPSSRWPSRRFTSG